MKSLLSKRSLRLNEDDSLVLPDSNFEHIDDVSTSIEINFNPLNFSLINYLVMSILLSNAMTKNIATISILRTDHLAIMY